MSNRRQPLKQSTQRAWLISLGIGVTALAITLIVQTFEDNIVFYLTPSEALSKQVPVGKTFRLGGIVEKDSFRQSSKTGVSTFNITDMKQKFSVTYRGILPDLFREGQGVVAEGVLQKNGTFKASSVLAKHDENYKPPVLQKIADTSAQNRQGSPK